MLTMLFDTIYRMVLIHLIEILSSFFECMNRVHLLHLTANLLHFIFLIVWIVCLMLKRQFIAPSTYEYHWNLIRVTVELVR